MARKNVVKAYKMIDAADASSNIQSNTTSVINMDKASISLTWAGDGLAGATLSTVSQLSESSAFTLFQSGHSVGLSRAQQFTADANGKVSGISLKFDKLSATTGQFTMTLESDNSNAPSGTVLATKTLNLSDLTSGVLTEYLFDASYDSISSGTPYWIVFRLVTPPDSAFDISYVNTNPLVEFYAISSDGIAWTTNNINDIVFSVDIKEVTSSVIGTIEVVARNGEEDQWQALDFGSAISVSGTSGDHRIVLNELPFTDIRVDYSSTSGAGTLTAIITAKQVGG